VLLGNGLGGNYAAWRLVQPIAIRPRLQLDRAVSVG
jgi:hypothetical protein